MSITQLEKIASSFVDAWNSHDMDAFGDLFQVDAEFVNVYGAWWTGRSQIQREHQLVHATIFRDSTLEALEVRTKQLNPAVAHVHVRWTLKGIRSPAGPLPDRTGVMLIVAVLEREWRVAAAQNTDVSAPPA